jgi:hypothetical protein
MVIVGPLRFQAGIAAAFGPDYPPSNREIRMVKKIGLGIVAGAAVLAIVIATRPANYRISRSETAQAPPGTVYAQVVDFHRWRAWSPWERLDPNMRTVYGGTDGAPGATYAWKGNDSVGEGRMTLLEARSGELVGIRLEFLEPFSSVATTRFDFAPRGAGTQITWTMEGSNDFAGKAFSMVMNMDKMVGADFERGLAQLKSVAEAEARASSASR